MSSARRSFACAGYFVTIGPRPKVRSRLLASQIEAIAYVELENGEFEQRYWLPTYQRIEAQVSVSLLGDQRAVFRVVSRFRELVVNPSDSLISRDAGSIVGAQALDSTAVRNARQSNSSDTLRLTSHRLTFAAADSLDRYGAWSRGIGELSGAARADDFSDIAPDAWRPTGRPIVRLRFQESSDLFHYNRIEGALHGHRRRSQVSRRRTRRHSAR